MKTVGKAAIIATLLAGAFALSGWAQQTSSEASALARYQRYAGAPVDHVRYYQVQGFQYLAPDKLAIRFAVNQMYLLTVQTPCNNLAFANGIALTAKNNTLYSNLDFVKFDHQQCKILKIVPVNELKMKQDEAKAKTSAPASSS